MALTSTVIHIVQDSLPYKKDDFITLKLQQKIEQTTYIDLKHYNVTKTGNYRIVVSYSSPVPRELAPEGIKSFSLEDGRIEFKSVEFKIRK